MSAAEHLREAIATGCTRDDHDHIAMHRAEVIAEFEAYPGEIAMLRGLLGVIRVVAKHGDMDEVRRLLAEHASDEQAAYAEEKDTATTTATSTPAESTDRVLCAHGYVLLQDTCPGCDAEEEKPHDADPVSVYSRWAKADVRRCRKCGMSPSHHIHKQGGAPRV